MGERFTDHLRKYEAKLEKSVFWLHCRDDHNGVFQRLEVSIVCKRSYDTMLRQVAEAVFIEEDDPVLNKPCEWGNGNVP